MRDRIKNTNKVLFVLSVLGLIYIIQFGIHFYNVIALAEDYILGGIEAILLTPHYGLAIVATGYALSASLKNNKTNALITLILLGLSSVLYTANIMYMLPLVVLAFVGYKRVSATEESEVVTEDTAEETIKHEDIVYSEKETSNDNTEEAQVAKTA